MEDRSRFLRLHAVPETGHPEGARGTLVVIHGGYWKNKYGIDDPYGNAGTASLAPFFLERGFAAVELEYRRRDHEGGGWPGTNEDILAGLRCLGEFHAAASGAGSGPAEHALAGADERCRAAARFLEPGKVILVGHSAGGCLALWAAHQLAAAPGAVRVAAVVAAAPVADLVKGHELKVSDEGDAVELYMGCRPEGGDGIGAYQKASPSSLLPVTFPVLVAYGDKDTDVPPALCAGYAADARVGAPELVVELCVPDADHFDVVNSRSEAWRGSIAPGIAELVERSLGPEAAEALRS